MPFTNEDRHMAVFTYIGASYWEERRNKPKYKPNFPLEENLRDIEARFYIRHLSQQNVLFRGAVE